MITPSIVLLWTLTSSSPSADEPSLAQKIEACLQPLIACHHLSGTLLVARNGEVLFERAYGMADYELGVANTPDTRFCIASITKPMTQALAVQLIEEGKLSASDKIVKWLEDFPRGEEITISNLLNHTAGIPHRVTSEADEAHPVTAEEMVELVSRAALAPPGGPSRYSSAGYSVLARILELVTGMSYGDLLQERLFAPAGMTNSIHICDRSLLPRRARSYFPTAIGLENAPLKDLSFLVGAGSVWSTPRDLHLMLHSVASGKLGANVKANLLRSGVVNWSGITNGYRSFLDYDSRTGIEVVYTGNILTGAAELLRTVVPRILRGEDVAPCAVPDFEAVSLPSNALQAVEGTYEIYGNPVKVRRRGDLLYAGDRPLIPLSDRSFFSPCDYGTVEVMYNPEGSIRELLWGTVTGPLHCPRMNE